ncbi:hypothetical protein LEP1GSC062_0635 [Leptospira alexanderi serovar Manhao 3 str. L 60]|uniref:Uncharacterized protein n=1 Tax=Leptospira alexanderi serovar Manhao 3 str. L 60 TaxID=1049759 RepID=V6I1B5_9LEPT|nr:hypothetical protein LEP1GSC062_0635 [Leptospira alexanderi serovar Manhao 3 str. L 60]
MILALRGCFWFHFHRVLDGLLLLSGDFVFYSFPLDSVLFTLFVFLTLFQGRLSNFKEEWSSFIFRY